MANTNTTPTPEIYNSEAEEYNILSDFFKDATMTQIYVSIFFSMFVLVELIIVFYLWKTKNKS